MDESFCVACKTKKAERNETAFEVKLSEQEGDVHADQTGLADV